MGRTLVKLPTCHDTGPTGESHAGDRLADASRLLPQAEVAVIHGGGIRGDRTKLRLAELTRKAMVAELLFDDVAMVIEPSGADLCKALANGVLQVQVKAARFCWSPAYVSPVTAPS